MVDAVGIELRLKAEAVTPVMSASSVEEVSAIEVEGGKIRVCAHDASRLGFVDLGEPCESETGIPNSVDDHAVVIAAGAFKLGPVYFLADDLGLSEIPGGSRHIDDPSVRNQTRADSQGLGAVELNLMGQDVVAVVACEVEISVVGEVHGTAFAAACAVVDSENAVS